MASLGLARYVRAAQMVDEALEFADDLRQARRRGPVSPKPEAAGSAGERPSEDLDE